MKCISCPFFFEASCRGETFPRLCERMAEDPVLVDHLRVLDGLAPAPDSPVDRVDTAGKVDDAERLVLVSRYNEDISWVNECPFAVLVYNKGLHIDYLSSSVGVVHLQNRGREAGTMLQHIVSAYDRLSEWTYFVQGNTHSGEELFGRIATEYHDTCGLTCRYKPDFPAPEHRVDDVTEVHGNYTVTLASARYHGGRAAPENADRLRTIWKAWFGCDQPQDWRYIYGAEIAVPRHRILARPLEFYQYALDMLYHSDSDPSTWDKSPYNAWSMELLWLYIFGDAERYPVVFPVDPKPSAMPAKQGCGCGHRPRVGRRPHS